MRLTYKTSLLFFCWRPWSLRINAPARAKSSRP